MKRSLRRTARGLAGIATVLTVGAASVVPAYAAPEPSIDDVTLVGGTADTPALWYVTNEGGATGVTAADDCSGVNPGLSISDAELADQSDAFDLGLTFWLDGTQIAAPATWDVELDGEDARAVTAGPSTIDGLDGIEVTTEYRAFEGLPLLRSHVVLENTGDTAKTVTFTLATNVGSDDSTLVVGSSSGDTEFTTADRWVATADDAADPSDPVNLHVLAGPDDPEVLPGEVSLEVFDCSDPDGVGASYEVTIPAGDFRSLLFFNGMLPTVDDVADNGSSANTRPPEFALAGIPVAERGEIVNWQLSGTVTKAADAAESQTGAGNGYTITANNPTGVDAAISSFVDALPAGFSYVAGSSTVNGVAVADPTVDGDQLTWAGPFTAPANGAAVLAFDVTVSSTAGTYTNTAAAVSPDLDLSNDGAEASVTVVAPPALPADELGYRLVAADGGIFTFGDRDFFGSTGNLTLNKPIVGGATDVSDNAGYWIVASDGGVFAFDAPFFGSLGDQVLTSPAVEIEPTPSGKGYWIVLANGKVYAFGDAEHFGDMSTRALNKPVIGMTVTPSGKGYWLVAQDGGIFNFGDADFFGSMGDKALNAPIIDLAPSVDNEGYYLLGRDGGVFTFGSASFKGSTGAMTLNAPVVAMLVAPNGAGYWLVGSDGGVFTFGAGVPFLGSMGGTKLNSPVLDLIL